MVKTRSSISPSHSVKIAADKKKMRNVSDDGDRDDSDRSGGSGGSSDGSHGSALQTKRKRVVEKVKKEDVRNVKKMKQVAEDLPEDYDSEDLEVEVRNDLKEWDLYFKPGEKIQGKVMLFPNQDNIVVKNINSKLTKDQRKFSLAEFAVVSGLLCVGDADLMFELTLHNIGLRGVMKGKGVSKPLAKVKGKHLEKGPRSYKLPGLPFAFLVWLYETIPLCLKARFCSYDSGKPYRFCRWKSIGNPNSSEVEKKVLSSNKENILCLLKMKGMVYWSLLE
ncbi:hypothetical protein CsatA_001915 [Cannabis sativa]